MLLEERSRNAQGDSCMSAAFPLADRSHCSAWCGPTTGTFLGSSGSLCMPGFRGREGTQYSASYVNIDPFQEKDQKQQNLRTINASKESQKHD